MPLYVGTVIYKYRRRKFRMGEEVKKSRPAPDPNSAKFKLGMIAAKAYSDCAEAKARGELVGWCASNFR